MGEDSEKLGEENRTMLQAAAARRRQGEDGEVERSHASSGILMGEDSEKPGEENRRMMEAGEVRRRQGEDVEEERSHACGSHRLERLLFEHLIMI
ncbi:unnamed protein product [Caenorhabditis sp. 36 PRJEB53466]|nr:unnamed protein product [Caenorhabditis sp. 36 PRJEB53466]